MSIQLRAVSLWYRGQEARIKETLHSSLRFDSNDGAYVGLTAAQGADRAVFSSR